MSVHPKTYFFTTTSQWQRCLLHRIDINGALTATRRLASRGTLIGPAGAVTAAAFTPGAIPYGRVDPAGLFYVSEDGTTNGPLEIDGALAASPRWVIDRNTIWAFTPDGTSIDRYERGTLQHEASFDAGAVVRDIASDGRLGAWLLLQIDDAFELLRIDCKGCRRERYPVPCSGETPTQLASVGRGRQLVLLIAGGRCLMFLDARTGAIDHVLSIGNLAACWSATHLASDGKTRLALWGKACIENKPPLGMSFVLDATGDAIDGPLNDADVFSTGPAQRSASRAIPRVSAIAVTRNALLLATDAGLWQLVAGNDRDDRESDGTILTPPLLSPDSDPVRGWLRAEVFINLPRGGVVEAEYATTDKEDIVAQARVLADDRSSTTQQKQEAIWGLLDHPANRRFRFTTAPASGEPLAIPIFESRDRWLWLRLKVMTPPGAASASLTGLRVLHPDLSLARYLPAAFQGERKDPSGTMRRLVGVIEATTQRLDERILSIGSHLDPRTAPVEWLDYLARWLDLPWDDELPEQAKRALLKNAGQLLDLRGTRAGVRLLLQSLFGDQARARITDLTVDHAASVIGGAALPALLAGTRLNTPTLGGKAVLGRACLTSGNDPLGTIVPTLHVEIVATPEIRRGLAPILKLILSQYVPAGVRVRTAWVRNDDFPSAMSDGEHVVLDAEGPGRLGRDSDIGRTILHGRKGKLDEGGLGTDFRLR